VVDQLGGQEAVLVVDETGDAKSSTDCVGAGRQYSGALGGVGLCQVAVHLAAVTATTRVIIDRALYLPADWAADEERRMVAGVPEEAGFATKPQQAVAMVAEALAAGIQARWFAADEVYCGRELRRDIRALNLGYTVGVPATHQVTDGAGGRREARKMLNKVRPEQWMRLATGHGTKGTREYDWAWLDIRADDAPDGRRRAPASWSPAATATPASSPTSAAGPRAPRPWQRSWKSSAAGGGSRKRSSLPRASPAWTRDN
jgi:SRSO17 transposase